MPPLFRLTSIWDRAAKLAPLATPFAPLKSKSLKPKSLKPKSKQRLHPPLAAQSFSGILLPGLLLSNILGLRVGLGQGRFQPAQPLGLGAVDIRPTWESAWVQETITNDPQARAILAGYLDGLSSAGYLSAQQGIWVATSSYAVAQHQGNVRFPAASLSKVATTLAALATWEPEHRFVTQVGWRGRLQDGVIEGDLIVLGGSDPLFVWEEAIALGNALQGVGIRQVTGDLIVAGDFTMNFEPDMAKSGALLKQALNSASWDDEVQVAYENLDPGTAKPTLVVNGNVQLSPASEAEQVTGWLVRHDSLPLVAILKAMNIYSNNPMAEQMARTVGGPQVVMKKAESFAGVAPDEILLVNGSGLGEENQMSPRAVVALLQKIQTVMRSRNYTLADVFPVAGADGGTLRDRALPPHTVVKTGTLAVVSTLAGALPTQDKGLVWFSLLNYGSGLEALRLRQDQVLANLENYWGKAAEVPPELKAKVKIGQDPYRFGDSARNIPLNSEQTSS